ncbi:hypothetical protein N7478_006793 [Penicillium angulare]|uniref:uncharacterized protein n=1 Tax=Penicillium angulare TaxID=116970 RepID=UPI0025403B9E|nr:uncharacterized protein N7478_006793 [Penicillium angulare]KAJ5281421.1 hypothetical protein N7478_006793 [Penicillium angulare]
MELYADSNCEELITVDSGTFGTDGCITQSGINSVRVTYLDNARVIVYSQRECDGQEWVIPIGTPGGDICIRSPGTESFKFSVGSIQGLGWNLVTTLESNIL